MKRYIEWITDHRKLVMVLTILITILAIFQARSIKVVIDTTKIMPQSNPYVSTSNDVERIFGSKHVVVIGISPKKGDVYQPEVLAKVQRMTSAFLKVPGVVKENILSISAKRAKNIIGNPEGLEVKPLLGIGPVTVQRADELRRAVEKNPVYLDSIVSSNGKIAAIIVEFKDEPTGFATMMAKVEPIVAAERDNTVDISIGGLPNFISHIEQYSERMAFLLPISFGMLCLVLYQAFRTRQGMFLPLMTALLAVVWSVGIMGASGIPMDVFNATTPILILAVATGHAVQLLKRYYEEYDALRLQPGMEAGCANRQAVINSLTHIGPVMLAAGCVASLGFFSLMVFDISAVRTFGIFTGLGIIAAMILEMTFIPALRCTLKPPIFDAGKKRRRLWFGVTDWIASAVTGSSRAPIYLVTIVVSAIAISGIFRIVEDNSVKKYFSPSQDFQLDDKFLNENLGGTNTIYLLVEGKAPDTIKNPTVLRAIADLQSFLDAQPGVGKTISIADFVKRMNRAMHGDDPVFSTIPDTNDLISQYLLLYSMSGEPGDFDSFVDYEYRNAKITAFIKTDSTAYTESLLRKVRDFAGQRLGPEVTLRIGGSAPQDTALNEAMVQEKLLNIAQIAAVVLIISSLIFRSVMAGFLVLLPLLLAVAVNFGIMGWSGILLNIPTSLTSAMAVGIGADYAIYLIFRLREEFAREPDPAVAIRQVLHSAGEAILFVATAVALGYGVLLFSEGFYIHAWLAILIGSAMLVSAISALVLIPSLVLSLRPAFIMGRTKAAIGFGTTAASATLLVVGMLALPDKVSAAEVDVTKIMESNSMVTKVADSIAEATFTLINRSGQERVRKVLGATKLQPNGRDNMRVTRFRAPPDVKGTVSLLIEHVDRDDDMWIYLPALKKTRRLVSNNKKDSFVGTDFSYADVIGFKTNEWNYKFLNEEVADGQPCYVIEATPKTDEVRSNTGYSRRIEWIRKDNNVTVKSEYWDENGEKLKISVFKDIQNVDERAGKWQPMRMESGNVQTGHKTIIVFDKFRVNQQLSDSLFTVGNMERE